MILLSAAVLGHTGDEVYDAASSAQADERQADAVALVEEARRIACFKTVAGNDTTNVAEPNLPRSPDGAAMMTTEIHGEPADNDWHGAVRPRGDQKECSIFHMSVMMHTHEDGKACNGDTDVEHGKEESMPKAIRDRSGDHAPSKSSCPGGD